MSILRKMAVTSPIRILVVGGSYAGLSAAVQLIDLCQGKRTRFPAEKEPHAASLKGFPLDVHIVDERDGYCSSQQIETLLESSN